MFSKWIRAALGFDNLQLKTFEVWVKTETRGVFIIQERSEMVDVITARSQEEANHVARAYGGYAVAQIKS